MSARNGDKSQFGRLRKQKLARRVVNRALRGKLLGKKADSGAAPKT